MRFAVLAVLLVARVAGAACGDEAGSEAAIAAARAAVALMCPCDTASHKDYVRCARDVAKGRVLTGQLPRSCLKTVQKCASRSTCGKPGHVTCCRATRDGTRCKVTTGTRCASSGGCTGAYASCCEACDGSGCATTSTTTTTSPPTTQPAVCGNGVIEAGEWCDGEEFCEANCAIRRFACCELATPSGFCSANVPAYTLFANQHGACGAYGGTFHLGSVALAGEPCAEPVTPGPPSQRAGACGPPPDLVAPASVCCQDNPTVCRDLTTVNQSAITTFVWSCLYNHYPAAPIVAGSCGTDGLCVPAQRTTTTTMPCGGTDEPCCGGNTCDTPGPGGVFLKCLSGACRLCGYISGPCCDSNFCLSTTCQGGTCVPTPPTLP